MTYLGKIKGKSARAWILGAISINVSVISSIFQHLLNFIAPTANVAG